MKKESESMKEYVSFKKFCIVVLSIMMVVMGCPLVKANDIYVETIINDSDVGESVNQFSFSDGWVHEGGYPQLFEGGDEHWTTKAVFNQTYPSYTLKFLGNQVTLYGHRVNDGCLADVYIDDIKVGEIDYYRNGRQNKEVLYQSSVLEEGVHTIHVVLNGNKNESAGNNFEAAVDYAVVRSQNVEHAPTGIQLSDSQVSLEEGMKKQVSYKLLPSYVTQTPKVIWTSEDTTIAEVDQNGLITGKSTGTTHIKATIENTEISSQIEVTIRTCQNEIAAIISDNNRHAYPEKYLTYVNDLYDKDLSSLQSWSGYAWKNDEVTSRIDIFTKAKDYKNAKLIASDFVDESGNLISKENVCMTYMDRAIAHTNQQSIFDIISHDTMRDLKSNQMYAAWVNIAVPKDAEDGIYKGTLSLVSEGQVLAEFTYQLEVLDLVLPELQSQIELWMYPYSSNRYYSGKSSSEYFGSAVTDLYNIHLDDQYQAGLESQLELYKKIGGDAITVTVVEDAWNSQTHDPYPSMVKWTRKTDGSFYFDYTDLDKWVELCMKHGIDKQIKAFSLSCWGNRITYFDEAAKKVICESPATGSQRWRELWTAFLKDYVKHMDEKGWFDIAYMSMDERPLSEVTPVLDLVESVKNKDGKSLKTSLAVFNFETESIFDRIDDLSLAITIGSQEKAKEIAKHRDEQGFITTIYTCGAQNSAMLNHPGESTASLYESYKDETDGLLRWAFDSFNADPLITSEHDLFAAGDLYLIYPDLRDGNELAQTSPRFEKLVEGARDIEKLRYLSENENWMQADIEKVVSQLNYDIPASQNKIYKLSKQAVTGPIIPSVSINEKDVELYENETKQLTLTVTPEDLLDEIMKETSIINDFDDSVKFKGNWHTDEGYPDLFYNGDDHWCAPKDAEDAKNYSYEFDFYGDSFAIIGNLEYLNGKFDVYIDGNLVTTVDAYSPGRILFSRLYESDILELKNHHVIIQGNGTKNDQSTAFNMQLDYIETYVHNKLEWSSSNDEVVSVQDGMLTARQVGKAIITVKASDYTDSIYVLVKSLSVVDTSHLETIIESAEKLDLSKYEEDGKAELKKALENAKQVLANPDNQEVVDNAINALEKAMKELVEVAVIPINPTKPDKPVKPNDPAKPSQPDQKPESPQTGDSTMGMIYGSLAIASFMIVLYGYKRRKDN